MPEPTTQAILESIVPAAVMGVIAYMTYRLLLTVYTVVFSVLDYRASSHHLMEKSAAKRGSVTRNLPKGSAAYQTPPLAFPNGWFFIDESSAIRREEVRNVSMLGLELAVFRDAKGQVYALDAYCPHLGANMAIGGRVSGGCLECPFHGWQFRGSDGKCVHIPQAKRVPDSVSTRSWHVLERNGAVLLWHHADDREPDWFPPELEEYTADGYTQLCGRTEHIVYSHIQDIPENGADLAHFEPVHNASIVYGSDVRQVSTKGEWLRSLLRHSWNIVLPWVARGAPEGHVGIVHLTQDIYFGDIRLPLSHFATQVSQIGPGIVYLRIQSQSLGNLLLCQYVVPEEVLKQRLSHVIYSRPGTLNRLYAKIIIMAECTMVERDIQIWNNKCYRPKPVLAPSASDESILRFRRWFSQFYKSSESEQTKTASTVSSSQCSMDW